MDVSNITSVAALPRQNRDGATPVGSAQQAAKDLKPSGSSDSTSDAQADSGSIDAAVADIQSFVQTVKRGLNFNVDDSSGEVVVKVIDTDSGKLVRQIPSEELLKLAERLEDIRSLMFEAKA
jgi:flagellar protein FlaG